jgi:hypothetical protein
MAQAKPILVIIIIIFVIGGAILMLFGKSKNDNTSTSNSYTLDVSWKGKKIKVDNEQDIVSKAQEYLVKANDVYSLAIPNSNFTDWKKKGFVVELHYSELNNISIPVLSDEIYNVSSIIIIDADTIPGYIIIRIDSKREFVLYITKNDLQSLRTLCGIE